MKKSLIGFAVVAFLSFGCSNDDDSSSGSNEHLLVDCTNYGINKDLIVGKWKLVAVAGGYPEHGIHSYAGKNVIYNYHQNGQLTITGNGPFSSGTFPYEFKINELDYWEYIKIDRMSFMFCINENAMILGQSYVDGVDYHFVKI